LRRQRDEHAEGHEQADEEYALDAEDTFETTSSVQRG